MNIKIAFQFFTFFSAAMLCASCSHSSRTIDVAQSKIENDHLLKTKPQSNFSDTLKINSAAAVFYAPDSLQLEKIKSVTTANVFDANMHEYFSLIKNAHSVIKKYYAQIKIIEAKNVRYLLFITADKITDCVDLDSKKDIYGLFIFNRQKPPVFTDMANIETELGFYFNK